MKGKGLFDCLNETEKKQGKLRGMISAAIENKRYELGMTQKQFAEHLGITQGMVSKLESSENNISVDKLIELFENLDIKYKIEIDEKVCINNSSTKVKGIEYFSSGVFIFDESYCQQNGIQLQIA
mgnify:CR=1 FL=1